MLDPVKNAKAVGILSIIGVVLSAFSLLVLINLGQILYSLIFGLELIFSGVTGVGLILGKKWGVYLFGVSIIFSVGLLAYQFIQNGNTDMVTLILDTIFIAAFFWFFNNREKFS